jgi:hypothetical protein
MPATITPVTTKHRLTHALLTSGPLHAVANNDLIIDKVTAIEAEDGSLKKWNVTGYNGAGSFTRKRTLYVQTLD